MQTDVWNILDTCAFFTQTHPDGKIATVKEIDEEIVNKQSKQYYSNLKTKGLKIIEPKKYSIDCKTKQRFPNPQQVFYVFPKLPTRK